MNKKDKEIANDYKATLERLMKPFQGLGPRERREAVLKAYSESDLKERFEQYDHTEGQEDWSGLVRMDETCAVCSETYIARGRQNSIGICTNCLDVHVSIRDRDMIEQEKQLDILLQVYGCKQSG